jgi:hypothetical protein
MHVQRIKYLKYCNKNIIQSHKSYIYLYFYDPLQLICVNFLNMHIGPISTQSEHVTSALNQYSQGPIVRFTPKPISFNLAHNQPLSFTF